MSTKLSKFSACPRAACEWTCAVLASLLNTLNRFEPIKSSPVNHVAYGVLTPQSIMAANFMDFLNLDFGLKDL